MNTHKPLWLQLALANPADLLQ